MMSTATLLLADMHSVASAVRSSVGESPSEVLPLTMNRLVTLCIFVVSSSRFFADASKLSTKRSVSAFCLLMLYRKCVAIWPNIVPTSVGRGVVLFVEKGGGNPGGSSINTNNVTNGSNRFGTSGTGGTLIIFCTGFLLGGGTISSNGTDGVTYAGAIGGGGASGGGSITIVCNSNSSSITRSVSGGTAGAVFPNSPYNAIGGNGGSGSERVLAGL